MDRELPQKRISGAGLKATEPRDRIWTDTEIGRWLDAAASYERFVSTGFLLSQYTAQRPGDVLKMSWPQYSGTAVRLRQQKTDKLLDVPPHRVLRNHLDNLPRSSTSLTILHHPAPPVTYGLSADASERSTNRSGSMRRRVT